MIYGSIQMPQERREEIWDKLYDKTKNIILVYDNSGPSSSATKPFSKPNSSFQRKVNLHEMSVFDFIQSYSHQMEDTVPDYSVTALSNDHNSSPDTLQ